MEADTGMICQGNGRVGHWFTYIDSYATSTITPAPTQVPALPYAITTPRASSHYAMRAFGTYTSYAGIAALMNNAVIGQTPLTFNASNYTGVRFTTMGTGGVAVIVQTPATESTTYGGTCAATSCYGFKSATYALSSTAWNTYSVPFSSFSPGVVTTLDRANIWSVEFQPTTTGSFDLWIDDVTFY
jgi:hypothetical protein